MRNKKLEKIFKYFLVILGTFVCAFGNVVFLKPLEINAGGSNGIGIIFMHFASEGMKDVVYNIAVDVVSVGCWFIGLFFIGKEFAFKTIIASIVFPVATALLTVVPGISDVVKGMSDIIINFSPEPTIGTYILCSLAGGVLVGFGVGVTFVGGGSTGGVDVFPLMMEKLFNLKESIASFINDGIVVFLGIILLCANEAETYLMPCLTGILSIAVTSLFIDIVYVRFNTNYQIDIISKEWEKISRYIQDILEKGATIVPIKGGYKLEDKIMLRTVLNNTQYHSLKAYIAEIDTSAFITVVQSRVVFGEGFKKNRKNIATKKK